MATDAKAGAIGESDASTQSDGSTAMLADATVGVTCTTVRRNDMTCTNSATVETNVHFWIVPYLGDPEGGISTDSPGILFLYIATAGDPIFHADATHAIYTGYDTTQERITRTGNAVAVKESARRGGVPLPKCNIDLLVDVHCTGTTTLGH